MPIRKRFFTAQPDVTIKCLLTALERANIDVHYSDGFDSQADLILATIITDIAALGDPPIASGELRMLYADNAKNLKLALATVNVGLIITDSPLPRYENLPLIISVAKPEYAFALLCQLLYPENHSADYAAHDIAIAPSAHISSSARIGNNVTIGANAYIGDNVIIGDNSSIGRDCVISDDCHIGYGCVIRYSCLGSNCRIHSGAVIGERGFGYALGGIGDLDIALPHIAGVSLGCDVDIGSNVTIDRGKLTDTVLGDGVKLDNLVHLAHNVEVGCGTFMAAQVAVSGSTCIGERVMIGGQSALAPGITIGDRVFIAACSCLLKDLPSDSRVCGCPALEIRHFMRSWLKFRNSGREVSRDE